MTSTTVGTTTDALAISAFGFEIRLWQGSTGMEWSATIEDGNRVFRSQFEEDNLTLAKLHILEDARARGIYRLRDNNLPSCESLIDEWHEATLVTPD
jgi:hypothetical protein